MIPEEILVVANSRMAGSVDIAQYYMEKRNIPESHLLKLPLSYIQGFPLPEIFFSHLIDGYMSLGESYLVSLPYFSWQMVLVGDPLYQPFKPVTK